MALGCEKMKCRGELTVLGGLNLCGEQQFPLFRYNEFIFSDVAHSKILSLIGDGHCTNNDASLYYVVY